MFEIVVGVDDFLIQLVKYWSCINILIMFLEVELFYVYSKISFLGGFQHESRFNQMFANGRYVSRYCLFKGDERKETCFCRDYRGPVSYTHLRAHETDSYLVCRLLLEK